MLGSRRLTARQPADPAAVNAAEKALGISPDARPIYAYVGDLNPELGTIGLIIERQWLRTLTGVTKCDSGGLAGRYGAFAALSPTEAMTALRDLSFMGMSIATWAKAFADEVDTSAASSP